MVVEIRQLPNAPRKGDREPARRIVIAKQGLRDGASAQFAGIPRFQNRRYMLGCPSDAQRPSVLQNEHDWFARPNDSLQKFLLLAGKIEVGTVKAFAGNLLPFTQSQNHDISFLGQ